MITNYPNNNRSILNQILKSKIINHKSKIKIV